jgi:hypothetical protein
VWAESTQRKTVHVLLEFTFHQPVYRGDTTRILTPADGGQRPRTVGGDGPHSGLYAGDVLAHHSIGTPSLFSH